MESEVRSWHWRVAPSVFIVIASSPDACNVPLGTARNISALKSFLLLPQFTSFLQHLMKPFHQSPYLSPSYHLLRLLHHTTSHPGKYPLSFVAVSTFT